MSIKRYFDRRAAIEAAEDSSSSADRIGKMLVTYPVSLGAAAVAGVPAAAITAKSAQKYYGKALKDRLVSKGRTNISQKSFNKMVNRIVRNKRYALAVPTLVSGMTAGYGANAVASKIWKKRSKSDLARHLSVIDNRFEKKASTKEDLSDDDRKRYEDDRIKVKESMGGKYFKANHLFGSGMKTKGSVIGGGLGVAIRKKTPFGIAAVPIMSLLGAAAGETASKFTPYSRRINEIKASEHAGVVAMAKNKYGIEEGPY